jgi:pyruvate formate lyase activating enzyme
MLGKIHQIESLATHDGAGLRVAVFMHGCNLRCCYCHNPNSWVGDANLELSADELVEKIARFKPYFGNTGGVTFTGGEPLKQAVFLTEVLKKLDKLKIDAAIDTACTVLNNEVKQLFSLPEFVIADLKFYNKEQYIKHTGADVFDAVLQTLSYLNQINKPLILRTVIIPNINDTKKDMVQYANIAKLYGNIKEYELKPFHTMGFGKYEAFNITNPLESVGALDMETLNKLNKILKSELCKK